MSREERLRRAEQLIRRLGRRIALAEFDAQEAMREIRVARRERSPRSGRPKETPAGIDPHEGAAQVLMAEEPGLGLVVHIDACPITLELRRRRMIEALLIALCAKHSRVNGAANGMVPFKSSEELMDAMQEITGSERIGIRTLRNHVRRLRRLMVECHLDPAFVETGRGGYRFRLRAAGRVIRRRGGEEREVG